MILEPELHALARARERYGLDLTPTEYLALSLKVQAKQGLYIGPSKGGKREVWCVPHGGRWLVAVYDPRPARIVTFLPFHRQAARVYGPSANR